jgi:7-cyano-7-deazaguanine synthase
MNMVYILWTGGWDSTFRVVELSRRDVNIQPIYVVDSNRISRDYEKESMNQIVEALQKRQETKAKFLPIIYYKLEDIPKDSEISKAYKIIHEETGLGSQHEWLACLGKLYPGIEMGTEAAEPETNHMIHAISKYADLEVVDGVGKIKKETSSNEGNLVLGWFTFPIITRTESDMLEQIKLWGYEDVMKLIWFCHRPINGKPCGFCHPCEVKMESSMEWLLPKAAQKRYKYSKFISKICGERCANAILRRVYYSKNN